MIDINIVSKLIELVGELLIAFAVVRVHSHLKSEHRLDDDVYKVIQKEHGLVILAVILLVIAFILQFYI